MAGASAPLCLALASQEYTPLYLPYISQAPPLYLALASQEYTPAGSCLASWQGRCVGRGEKRCYGRASTGKCFRWLEMDRMSQPLARIVLLPRSPEAYCAL